MRKILIIVLPVLVLAVVIMLFTPVSYYLSREYSVTRYLKMYNINTNSPSNLRVTANYTKILFEAKDRREEVRNSIFERIMPEEIRSDVLDIYNKMNGTNIQSLPSKESMIDDFIIYETQVIDFHGIKNEAIGPSGENYGNAAWFTVYTFYTRGNYREPALAYILVTNWYGAPPDVLPIDMEKDEFAAYFDAIKTYYIDYRKNAGE